MSHDDPQGDDGSERFGVRVNYQDDAEKLRAAEFLVAGRAERESFARTVAAAHHQASATVSQEAVFAEVARTHNEAAAKLELLAAQCRSGEDRIDLLSRADVERSLAATATGRSEEDLRLP